MALHMSSKMEAQTMNLIIETLESLKQSCTQGITRFDLEQGIAWYFMNTEAPPSMTLELLADYRTCRLLWEQVNRAAIKEGKNPPIHYAVHASLYPGVFNYGGDLELFVDSINKGDREGLRTYARMCIESVYLMSVNLNLPMTMISLVQGDALGGGFEAALSCNVIIAERKAQFGFPEILFNLFPGMGGYSILSRKIGPAQAEKIITSGALYTAAEMYEIGVVDLLVEDGEGEKAVYEYVSQHSRKRNAFQSIFEVRQRVYPISEAELMEIADIWVDAAMKIGSRDLRIMERLIRAQEKVQEYPGEILAQEKIRA